MVANNKLSALVSASLWLLVNAPVEARAPEPACVRLLRLLVRDARITDPSGEAMAAGQVAAMRQALHEMGFSNYPQYQQFLDQRPRFARLTDVLRHERVEFAIHAPEAHRELIAQGGYQRLTEARLDAATDPQDPNAAKRGRNYLETRDRSEALHTNMSYFEKYKYLPGSTKPVYGLLRPEPTTGLQPHLARNYGDDVWILKKAQVRERTTLTLGDSLNRANPDLMWGPFNVGFGQTGKLAAHALMGVDLGVRRSWGSLTYIPWSHRELIIPAIQKESELTGRLETGPVFRKDSEKKFFRAHYRRMTEQAPAEGIWKELFKIVDEAPLARDLLPDAPGKYRFVNVRGINDYIELQIWGGVPPEALEKFIFYKTPPDPTFAAHLQRLGIPVYDGRDTSRAPVPYLP